MWSEAVEAIKASSKESSVYIGCDSQRFKMRGLWWASYATVVVVHKDSCHGCKLFFNLEVQRDYGSEKNLRPRLLNEVNYSTQAFDAIHDVLDGRHVEIHLDVNPSAKHSSNVVTQEAIGWVRGLGVVGKIKPDGWAATHAADHCVRGKSLAKRMVSKLMSDHANSNF